MPHPYISPSTLLGREGNFDTNTAKMLEVGALMHQAEKFSDCQRQMVSINHIDVWDFNLVFISKPKQQLKGPHRDAR